MFGFTKNHKTIQVQFIETGSEKPFARSPTPIDQLPETFEVRTTLHIGDEEWVVDRAEPATKVEFRRTGAAKIYLSKPNVVSVPLSEILYSLASIHDELPKIVDASLENVFVTHEDDWRQNEFVSEKFRQQVEQEFSAIRQIYQTYRKGNAFKSIHVRKLIPAPLDGVELSLSELKQRFEVAHEYSGIAFSSAAAVVENGFAFKISDQSIFWGKISEQGIISALCIQSDVDPRNPEVMVAMLKAKKLLYVDWNRCSL
jgi:hypothetical protein